MKASSTIIIALIILSMVIGFSGCNNSKNSKLKAINSFIILDKNIDNDDIVSKFDKWWQESQHIKKSSFSLWQIDEKNTTYRCLLLVKIPDSWGGQIKSKKESFTSEAVNAILNLKNIEDNSMKINVSEEIVFGDDRIYDFRKKTDINNVKFDNDSTNGINLSICVDMSSSTKGNPFDSTIIFDIYRSWLKTAYLRQNSSISFYLVGNTYNDCSNIFNIKTNSSISMGENYIYLASQENKLLKSLNIPVDNSRASAVLEAVYLANEQLQEQKGNKYIYILSDGRQISPGIWNFEQLIPTQTSFLNWQKTNYLLNLNNINVVMTGFHNKKSNDYGSSFQGTDSKKIKSLWDAVFSNAGAKNIKLIDKYSSLFN